MKSTSPNLELEKDFWYIDPNGRIQFKNYQPEKIDEAAEWFGNKFDSCEKACMARDKVRKLLYGLNPAKNPKSHWSI